MEKPNLVLALLLIVIMMAVADTAYNKERSLLRQLMVALGR